MGRFSGKKVLVLGVANERSIAHSITTELVREGATVALTYMNEAIEKRVRPIAEELGIKHVYQCDVQNEEHIDKLFADLKDAWGSLDGMVHSIAFADREDLSRRFVETSRSGFQLALDVSAYSLVSLSKRAEQLMSAGGGSIVTLTYLGSERVVKNYNVMGVAKAALEASVRYLAYELGEKGIRVNAISAGPIKTLAASGIAGFKDMLSAFAEKAPLRRNTSLEDVAKASLFMLGDDSSGVTGETLYVDCGFNIMGM